MGLRNLTLAKNIVRGWILVGGWELRAWPCLKVCGHVTSIAIGSTFLMGEVEVEI